VTEAHSGVASAPVRIAAGSSNPAKVRAVEIAAASFFDRVVVEGIDVPSGVSGQPWGDDETAQGALLRAERARMALDADFGVGIESGVADGPFQRLYVVSWAVAVDRLGASGSGGSERFPLPAAVAAALHRGDELGPHLDRLVGIPGISRREGTVSLITGGRRNRTEILVAAVLHAFAALLRPWSARPSDSR
jgi:inosine/xanthosine triphosphatase